jgi:hypothetical protein
VLPCLNDTSYTYRKGWLVTSFLRRVSYALWQKHYTGGPLSRLRGGWYYLARGYRYEICEECGRPVGLVWVAPDDLWLEVAEADTGIRCIPCFDAELERRGIFASWSPTLGA